jgi:hypothetical protein
MDWLGGRYRLAEYERVRMRVVNESTIVCGPPGSGKTTYVKERIQPGDLVYDLDDLWCALTWQPRYAKPDSLLPYMRAVRGAIVSLLTADINRPRSWIITCGPTRAERSYLQDKLRAEVVMLAVDAKTCIERIQADSERTARRADWKELVDDWWAKYEA